MTHAVRYHTPGGEARFEELDSLDAAVARVERLRNEDGVEDVRVFEHVPIQFETYVRVVVDDGAPATDAATGPEPADAGPAPAVEDAGDDVPEEAAVAPPPGSMPLTPPG